MLLLMVDSVVMMMMLILMITIRTKSYAGLDDDDDDELVILTTCWSSNPLLRQSSATTKKSQTLSCTVISRSWWVGVIIHFINSGFLKRADSKWHFRAVRLSPHGILGMRSSTLIGEFDLHSKTENDQIHHLWSLTLKSSKSFCPYEDDFTRLELHTENSKPQLVFMDQIEDISTDLVTVNMRKMAWSWLWWWSWWSWHWWTTSEILSPVV